MSHIKDRLKQYKDKYSDCYKYAGVHVKVIQDMIEQLLADLEQDEKENGWIPVKYHQISEKEREEESILKIYSICLTAKCQMTDKKYLLLTEKQHGKIQALLIVTDIILIAIMIGLMLRHGDHFQNHIRRTKKCG